MGLADCEITLLFVSDRMIQKYHAQYFDDPTPTDVISFPFIGARVAPSTGKARWSLPLNGPLDLSKEECPFYLGDILISLDTAARQAKKRGKSLRDEVKLLMVHGLLHLLGHDHQKKRDRQKMWRRQKFLLRKIKKL
ncbi:MAG: rRNA maturation RNase YbeY [Deltaproteobacteria bacterium]|nr:rRNA maturation RNase YbeY [Deltaproteobacteria bacterium]